MKQLVALVAIVLSLDGFGYYYFKNSTLDTTYEWGDKASWNGTQPTNFVSDSCYCSVDAKAGSATRTYVNPGYDVDFVNFGLSQWAGQTCIVHVAENSYIGVHAGKFAMNSNSGTPSYSELRLTNSLLRVYNADGSSTARDLMLGGNAGTVVLDLQKGSVYTNGTAGVVQMAVVAGADTHLNIEDSSFFAPYGKMSFGKVNTTSRTQISLRNGRFASVPPSGVEKKNEAALAGIGDFSMSLDHSEFSMTSGMSSGNAFDFGFTGYAANLVDIRAANGSLISLTNPHTDEGTTYGCLCFCTLGRVNVLLEDSEVVCGGLLFANTMAPAEKGAAPSRIEMRGKSTWRTLGHTEIDPASRNYRHGAEMFLRGGALDVTLSLGAASRGLLLDWTCMTNGCSIVKSVGDTGLGASLALHPDGGFQVVRTNAIELVRFAPSASVKTVTNGGPHGGGVTTDIGECSGSSRQPLSKSLFWQGGTGADHVGEAFGPDPDGVRYGVVFKDSAEVALDESFEPRASGYAVLPAIRAEKVKSAELRFDLVPQGTNTLAGIAARMTAAGYAAEVIDEEGYTIRANVPPELLADGTRDGRVWFDFTTIGGMEDARNLAVETRALVSKIGFKVVKCGGLMIILR